MKRSKISVQIKPRKGKGKANQVKAKLSSTPYVGNLYKIQSNTIEGQKHKIDSLKAQNDSLRRELDSLKVQLQIKTK